MKRREFIQRGARLSGGLAALSLLQACGGSGGARNSYVQANLVASSASYSPLIVDASFVNGWGIAIRPAGAGGHFWVTAGGASYEYVGDVGGMPLYADALALVALPESSTGAGAANGVVFNGGGNFVVTQAHPNGPITNPAKFLFVSDNGVLSAWTERPNADGSFDRPTTAVGVLDDSAAGGMFFGLAMLPGQDGLLIADFGASPRLRWLDAGF